MTVGELIIELQKQDQDAPVILHVYGHTHHSVDDRRSHGAMVVHKHLGWDSRSSNYNTQPGVAIRASAFRLKDEEV